MSDAVPPHPPRDDDNRPRSVMDWEARFQEDDTPWERAGLHPALSDWLADGTLQPGQRVFFPGCGRSLEPLAAAKAGLHITLLDNAPSAMAWQRDQFDQAGLEADFIEEDGLSWQPDDAFDRVYEQTFLCAISPKQRPAYEDVAQGWLKPGGMFLALFMQKDERGGPPYGCSLAAMRALFEATRWTWPQDEAFTPYPHPGLNNKAELGGILIRK